MSGVRGRRGFVQTPVLTSALAARPISSEQRAARSRSLTQFTREIKPRGTLAVFPVELSGDVFEVLPNEAELTKTQKSAMGDDEPVVVGSPPYVQTVQIGDIADHLNEERIRVRQEIEQLKNDTNLVDSVVISGEECFYRT